MSLADPEGSAESNNASSLPARSWRSFLDVAADRLSPMASRRLRLGALVVVASVTGVLGLREVLTPTLRPPVPAPEAPSLRSAGPRSPAAPDVDLSPVLKFRPLSPAEAYLANAAIPTVDTPDPAAAPLVLRNAAGATPANAATCLAQAVYYEAGSESLDGQRAVAQVVLNRVRDPRFPGSVCGVVFQGVERVTGCQFSFTCDGSMRRTPSAVGWLRAQAVAEAALGGYVMAEVGHATHYHTVWVTPYWSPSLIKLGRIGAHIFYRWGGGPPVGKPAEVEAAPLLASDDPGPAADAPVPADLPAAPAPSLIKNGVYSPPPRPAPTPRPDSTAAQVAAAPVSPASAPAPALAHAVALPPPRLAETAPLVPIDPPYQSKSLRRSLDSPDFAARQGRP